jgi:hypothetical protein
MSTTASLRQLGQPLDDSSFAVGLSVRVQRGRRDGKLFVRTGDETNRRIVFTRPIRSTRPCQ